MRIVQRTHYNIKKTGPAFKENTTYFCAMSGSHGGEYEDDIFLGCSAV
jgi:hypothetical protein